MPRSRLYYEDPKMIREHLNRAYELVQNIQQKENELTNLLYTIDQQRLYVVYGYKSLKGFCNFGLKLSRTQSQRITTQVRRTIPMVKIGQ
jgi:hypothetical protein